MSEALKTKYEVLKIIRTNVLMGLSAFGEETVSDKNKGDKNLWQCMEANQPSYQNFDKVVLLELRGSNRIGLPSITDKWDREARKTIRISSWIEQQEWIVKVLFNRTTEKKTADTITTEDVASMLASWFNDLGCAEFRKHNCGCLFVQSKDIKPYLDKSSQQQMGSMFVLKLQIPKSACFEIPDAKVSPGEFVEV